MIAQEDGPKPLVIHYSVDTDDRDRNRRLAWGLSWPGAAVFGGFAGAHIALSLVSLAGTGGLGAILGAGGALLVRAHLEPRFQINNPTTGLFMTIDPLKRLLGKPDWLTLYGPGKHYCYPQEERYAENNISLTEATVTFDFMVTCADGLLKGTGSFRLRADPNRPVQFQMGVAAVAADLIDLIVAEAVEKLATKKTMTALRSLPLVNDHLGEIFVQQKTNEKANANTGNTELGDTTFERRFGVVVGDVTIGQLLPTEELQRTLTAQTEAAAIAKGTAIMLGYTSMKKVNEAVVAKILTEAQVKDARDRFLSVSGNLEGMNISRNEYVLDAHGISPELAEAITALAANAPEAIQAMRAIQKPKGGRK